MSCDCDPRLLSNTRWLIKNSWRLYDCSAVYEDRRVYTFVLSSYALKLRYCRHWVLQQIMPLLTRVDGLPSRQQSRPPARLPTSKGSRAPGVAPVGGCRVGGRWVSDPKRQARGLGARHSSWAGGWLEKARTMATAIATSHTCRGANYLRFAPRLRKPEKDKEKRQA